MQNPYQSHSVWLDVAGVVLLLSLFLAPLAYLATSMVGGGGGWSGGGPLAGRGSGSASPPAPAVRSTRPHGGGAVPVPGLSPDVQGGGVPTAPFSDAWQARAAPDLTGSSGGGRPAAGGGASLGASAADRPGLETAGSASGVGRPAGSAPSVDGASGTGAWSRVGVGGEDGPALAARGPSAAGGSGPAGQSAGRDTDGRSAADEAERLAGQMRALSGQLGQMQGGASAASEQGQSGASAPEEPDAPSRREPGSPSNVPIGDHLHWLAVAGLLWGDWRIGHAP